MMLNLWVVRFEDKEVKEGWLWTSKKVQSLHQKAVATTRELVKQSEPVALRAAEEALCLTTNGLVAVANFSRNTLAKGLDNLSFKLADVHDKIADRMEKKS